MIVPNLMVRDVAASAAFYRDVIGMQVMIYVTPDREVVADGDAEGKELVFGTLEWNGHQLMLQRADSLEKDVAEARQSETPTFTGTIYFRDADTQAVLDRAAAEQVLKGPVDQWYGMREVYLRDPDGYVVCVGEKCGDG